MGKMTGTRAILGDQKVWLCHNNTASEQRLLSVMTLLALCFGRGEAADLFVPISSLSPFQLLVSPSQTEVFHTTRVHCRGRIMESGCEGRERRLTVRYQAVLDRG